MITYVVTGLAGAVGSLLRYELGLIISNWWIQSFPLATLLANYIGAFFLGWFTTWSTHSSSIPSHIRIGIGTGLIGSFTTFSTFSVETLELVQRGLWGYGIFYVLISLWGGLWLAWSGYRLARKQWEKKENERKKGLEGHSG
ncbi:fluoride efflux transporter CrcB [Microaerobacter geothermalis]|uniref:fluoride efflux transporter CrcB n=1 Tax=Microaerobacter geothermalis TaxID=674972 RepID=UPI001F1D7F47|nr:fluoride efflux transporter CrcB [Microaerobacter geothermalis]MCF6093718.1 fluoride efflux transporter CrcB [Microaerobacter geothermalis]